MILFFGTRPGKSKEKILSGLLCPSCNNADTLSAVETPNFLHLFWIPVYKLKTWQSIRCRHCKATFYQEEFTPQMKRALNS